MRPDIFLGRKYSIVSFLVVLTTLALMSSCAVMKYDATTDSQVTTVQKEIDYKMAELIVAAKDQAYYSDALTNAKKVTTRQLSHLLLKH